MSVEDDGGNTSARRETTVITSSFHNLTNTETVTKYLTEQLMMPYF